MSTRSNSAMPAPRRLHRGDQELAVYHWPARTKRQAPCVLLVHGYPDNASVWQKTAEQLAKSCEVMAYDVRGAGQSSRPTQVKDYALDHLVADMACVVDALSPTRPVHLVGHDWGSIQSWEAVTTPPLAARIASYTSISGPSLDHAAHWIRRRLGSASWADKQSLLKQLAHSWYIGAFHLPVLAPQVWQRAGERLWPRLLERVEGIVDTVPSSSQAADGACGVKLYRANVRQRLLRPAPRHTDTPVQLIVPRRDHFMIEEIWQDLPQWVPNLSRTDVDAGHWLPLSHPQLLAQKVEQFVRHIEAGSAVTTPKAARAHSRASTRKPVSETAGVSA